VARGHGGDGFTTEAQQLRIADCELRIEFEEGFETGELNRNPQFLGRLMDQALEGFLIFLAGFCDYLWR
jgi:hypothetical protein